MEDINNKRISHSGNDYFIDGGVEDILRSFSFFTMVNYAVV